MSLPPSLFFHLHLHLCFLPPSTWCLCVLSVGVWVTSFLLLACSRTASLVCLAPALLSPYDAFMLCFACSSGHVFVCLSGSFVIISHCLWRPVCLPESVLHACVLLFCESCYFLLVTIHSQSSDSFYLAFFSLCLHATCICLYFGGLAGVQQCCFKRAVCYCIWIHTFCAFHSLVYGFTCFFLLCFVFWVLSSVFSQFFWVVCAWLSPGLGGEHHEREDAKEGRTLVVLVEEQEQRMQISECTDTHIIGYTVLCSFPWESHSCYSASTHNLTVD